MFYFLKARYRPVARPSVSRSRGFRVAYIVKTLIARLLPPLKSPDASFKKLPQMQLAFFLLLLLQCRHIHLCHNVTETFLENDSECMIVPCKVYQSFQNPGNFCFLVESAIQLKKSGIPLTIGILNPTSNDTGNLESSTR